MKAVNSTLSQMHQINTYLYMRKIKPFTSFNSKFQSICEIHGETKTM